MDWDSISVDDLRQNRPDLYQEIVEDVLMSCFAGRSDEVYGIILPAINEMRAEIKTVTDQLKYDLEAIVEKQAKKRFKKLLLEIEKATVYKSNWQISEKKKIRSELLLEMKEQQNEFMPSIKKQVSAKKITPRKKVYYARIDDIILYDGVKYTVKNIKIERGMHGLVLTDKFGDDFLVIDDPSRYEFLGKENNKAK